MRYVACSALAVICTTVGAQTPPASPRFEVASVKPAANDGKGSRGASMMREMAQDMIRNQLPVGVIPMAGPERIRLDNWALLDLIAVAYSVRAAQVSGPAWLSDQGFDIEAKPPEGTPKGQLSVMLQALLEERFGLKVHRETRTIQGFVLTVGKNGPKLTPAEPPHDPAQELTKEEQKAKTLQHGQSPFTGMSKCVQENRGSGTPLGGCQSATLPSITTEQLAYRLARFAEAPVIDKTGLTGKYSVSIVTWKNADVPGGTVFDVVEKLGLKLEPRKVTVETVVIDQVSKTPTAN